METTGKPRYTVLPNAVTITIVRASRQSSTRARHNPVITAIGAIIGSVFTSRKSTPRPLRGVSIILTKVRAGRAA